METIWQDVRFGLRMLISNTGSRRSSAWYAGSGDRLQTRDFSWRGISATSGPFENSDRISLWWTRASQDGSAGFGPRTSMRLRPRRISIGKKKTCVR